MIEEKYPIHIVYSDYCICLSEIIVMSSLVIRNILNSWIALIGTVLLATAACFVPFSAQAQQLIPRMTGAQCAAMGGQIRTWTNTAGQGTPVGECYVPPRTGGGSSSGYSASGGPGGNAAAAIGIAGGVLGVIEALQGLSPPASEDPPAEGPVTASPGAHTSRRAGPAPGNTSGNVSGNSSSKRCRVHNDDPAPATCNCPAGTKKAVSGRLCSVQSSAERAAGLPNCEELYKCLGGNAKTLVPVKSGSNPTPCMGSAARKVDLTTEPSGFQVFARLKNTTDCAICFAVTNCDPDPSSAHLPLVCKDAPHRLGPRASDANWFNKKPEIKNEKYCK